jgi:hypothetical protein
LSTIDQPVSRTKDDGMTVKKLGWGFGVVVTIFAAVGMSSMTAYADGTCYTSCTPPTIGSGGGGIPPATASSGSKGSSGAKVSGVGSSSATRSTSGVQAQTTQATRASSGSLPFTGADIEELAVIGGAGLVVGGVMMRRGRRRRRAQV